LLKVVCRQLLFHIAQAVGFLGQQDHHRQLTLFIRDFQQLQAVAVKEIHHLGLVHHVHLDLLVGEPLRPHNEQVAFPIRWLSFTDDPIAPYGAVEALRPYYPRASVERTR
jgi:hypothetical protein